MRLFNAIFISFVIVACSTSPLGRRQLKLVPDAQIDQLGQQAFVEMKEKLKVSEDREAQAYVQCVVAHLISKVENTKISEWEIQVFEDKSPNAFALPGRRIGVHHGLFQVAKTQDQLAAVLGHEIAHVLANHGNERVSQALAVEGGVGIAGSVFDLKGPKGGLIMAALGLGAQFGILLPYSRIQESEADLIGLSIMSEAGFEPEASIRLWENMRDYGGSRTPEFMSTHPSHQTRIDRLQSHMPAAKRIFTKASRTNKPACDSARHSKSK